jgi:hypothetical protein
MRKLRDICPDLFVNVPERALLDDVDMDWGANTITVTWRLPRTNEIIKRSGQITPRQTDAN